MKKTNWRRRRDKAVIFFGDGSTINPSYEHHKDKLSTALEKIGAEEERERVIDEEPSLFLTWNFHRQ